MTSLLGLPWFKVSPLQNNLGRSPGMEGHPGAGDPSWGWKASGFLVARDRPILQQPATRNNGNLFWNQ